MKIFSQLIGITRSISFILFLFLANTQANDHAPLDPRHIPVAENFIKKHFKEGEDWDPQKISLFLERLEKEKKSLAEDIYETEIIENLELKLATFEKAKKSALKEVDEEKNKLILAYNKYLIPKITELGDLVAENKDREKWDGLAADFIRLYMNFYLPNAHRTIWPQDFDLKALAKHLFVPYQFHKKASRVEANNLVVEEETRKEMEECLKEIMPVGRYLDNPRLEKLEECSFDLSRANPGTSALWKEVSAKDREKILDPEHNASDFPRENDELLFDEVKRTSVGSAKFEVTYKNSKGKEEKLKIKLGQEVHSDIATSLMGKLLGFNQDTMLYRQRIKVNLGKVSYEQFETQMINTYGPDTIVRYLDSHGGTPGEEWVVFKDVLLEGKSKKELRLGGLDTHGWDLLNRREYRALLLWFAWFNIQDTKSGNFKILLKETDKGYITLHRLQDTGYSLGSALTFRHLGDPFKDREKYHVDRFEPSVLQWNQEKTSVKVWWNDFHNYHWRFSTTTWNDLKWMARKIARIKDADITTVLRTSGMPVEIIELYRHKLVSRRNEMVEAFDLEKEIPLLPVPDLSTYSPNPAIQNGKVVQSHFQGQHDYVQNRSNFMTTLVGFANLKIPFQTLNDQLMGKIKGTLNGDVSNLTTLNGSLSFGPFDQATTGAFPTVTSISPGISVLIGREVSPNSLMVNANGKSLPFYVKDTFVIEINFQASLFSDIIPYLPFNIQAGLKVYRKEFQFIHFAESLKEGYLKPFSLFNIAAYLPSYVKNGLDRMEVIKVSDSYGFEVYGNISAFNVGPLLTNEVGGQIGWRKTSPAYFLRDQFGALHIYKEKTEEMFGGLHFHLAKINALVASLPLIGLEFTHRRYFYEAIDYAFQLPVYNQDKTVMEAQYAQREKEAFDDFYFHGGEDEMSSLIRKNFHLKAKGAKTTFSRTLLYLFNKKWQKGHSQAAITMKNGKTRQFYRYFLQGSQSTGVENVAGMNNLLVPRGQSVQIAVEMDGNNQKELVATIRANDFFRTRSKEQLENLIEDLNERFSNFDGDVDHLKPEETFYRNFLLPEKEEVNLYRKVLSSTRIFVNGRALLDKVKDLPAYKMRNMAFAYLNQGLGLEGKRRNLFSSMGRKINRQFKLNALMGAFHRLKKAASDTTGKIPRTTVQALGEFLSRLDLEKFGVSLLREIMGETHLFVMGEIYGVYPSFSSLESFLPAAGRRFAGKSWGTYEIVPPIQKYIWNQKTFPPSFLISTGVQFGDIFGDLPTGVSDDK